MIPDASPAVSLSQSSSRPAPIPTDVSVFASPPDTLRGRMAGFLMALLNRPQNRMTLALLEVRPGDEILEIGFGPGTLLRMLARRTPMGFIAGLELSDAMLSAAGRRNCKAIRAGRMELKRGTVSAIPYEANRFDKVCTVNTIYFWPEPERAAAEIFRVMRSGGRAVICFRGEPPAGERSKPSLPPYPSASVIEIMRQAGFVEVRAQVRKLPMVWSACVVGLKA